MFCRHIFIILQSSAFVKGDPVFLTAPGGTFWRGKDLVGRKSNQSDRSTAIDFYFFNYGRQYFYFINHTKIKSKIDFYFWRQKLARHDGVMMAEETSFERQDDEIPF